MTSKHDEVKDCISCTVASCQNHIRGDHCNLEGISICPTQYGSTGKAADESMCGSYKCRS